MSWIGSEIELKGGIFPHHSHSFLASPSPPSSSSLPDNSDFQKQSHSSGNKITPVILFIIVILAIVFFICGLIHLLIRFLIKNRSSQSASESNSYPDLSGSDTVQRQLQQLFHLHDSGLDQAFIDALPVFLYKEIKGPKEPFDCAVCLCEFSENDKLRLLPLCSHAFHIDCIDTWLLSNSTCPLCRGTLFSPGVPFENPVFGCEEMGEEEEVSTTNVGIGASLGQKSGENEMGGSISRRVFSVRLGKFRSSNIGVVEERTGGETSRGNLDARRCYSMGSCQYVVSEMDLQVALTPSKAIAVATPGSFKLFKGRINGQNGNSSTDCDGGDVEGKKLNMSSKGESFSVSKIWQWSRKGKFPSSSETQIGSSANLGFAMEQ